MMNASEYKVRKKRLTSLAREGKLDREYANYLIEIARTEISLSHFISSANKGQLNYALLGINLLIDRNEQLTLNYRQKVKDWRLVRDTGAFYEARLSIAKDKLWETSPAEVL